MDPQLSPVRMALPDFGRSVNQLSPLGGADTCGFSDLPMALKTCDVLEQENVS